MAMKEQVVEGNLLKFEMRTEVRRSTGWPWKTISVGVAASLVGGLVFVNGWETVGGMLQEYL